MPHCEQPCTPFSHIWHLDNDNRHHPLCLLWLSKFPSHYSCGEELFCIGLRFLLCSLGVSFFFQNFLIGRTNSVYDSIGSLHSSGNHFETQFTLIITRAMQVIPGIIIVIKHFSVIV